MFQCQALLLTASGFLPSLVCNYLVSTVHHNQKIFQTLTLNKNNNNSNNKSNSATILLLTRGAHVDLGFIVVIHSTVAHKVRAFGTLWLTPQSQYVVLRLL